MHKPTLALALSSAKSYTYFSVQSRQINRVLDNQIYPMRAIFSPNRADEAAFFWPVTDLNFIRLERISLSLYHLYHRHYCDHVASLLSLLRNPSSQQSPQIKRGKCKVGRSTARKSISERPMLVRQMLVRFIAARLKVA